MAKGDGRGGNHGGAGNGDQSAHEVGPADIELGRVILLAREGNRHAVREALGRVSDAAITLACAAQCARKGALQSALRILEREFDKRFGEGEIGQVRPRQCDAPSRSCWKPNPGNTPIAELGLPVRVVNTLESALGAIYVDQLCKFSAAEVGGSNLGRGNCLGALGLKQIRRALASVGRALRGETVGAALPGDDDPDSASRYGDDGDD